eukprot:6346448-Alexandrium_andersonii.AAC.1
MLLVPLSPDLGPESSGVPPAPSRHPPQLQAVRAKAAVVEQAEASAQEAEAQIGMVQQRAASREGMSADSSAAS